MLGVLAALIASVCLLSCDFVAPVDARPSPERRSMFVFGTPVGETRPMTIYLPRRFLDDALGLQAVPRDVPATQEPAFAAAAALVAGPDGDERADDFQYPVDRRTRVRGVQVENGTAVLDFSEEIDRVRGRPYSELVYWSIVYTLTEVPGVERVALRRMGEPLREFGEPRFPISDAASRADAPAWVQPRVEARSTPPPR